MERNPITGKDEAFDFKGNLLRSTRQLVKDYKNTPDWSQNPVLEAEIFISSTHYDALNRPIQLIAPHSNQVNAKLNVIRPGYNEANLLECMDVWLEQPAEPAALLNPEINAPTLQAITNIDYDAKGQRVRIEYNEKNRPFVTEYTYDEETFRLSRLLTTRPNHPDANKRTLQDLSYTYDPVGNITEIRDAAQQRVFFDNSLIDPSNSYTYDALYRLVRAEGREHAAQNKVQRDSKQFEPVIGVPFPNNPEALQNYSEDYEYDAVGNILGLRHIGGAVERWTRWYQYALDGNRLLSTRAPGGGDKLPFYADTPGYASKYSYDPHGNMTTMPHLPLMEWDFKDQLQASSQQVRLDGGTPELTYYVYDASGQRVRKVTERQANEDETPRRLKERIYLGGFEVYRDYSGDGTTVTLERETLHVMDDKQRIALIETRTQSQGGDPAPPRLVRYQLGNHLGSAVLELDDQAEVISYEEYHPYGTTAYEAARSQTETPKRYRYTGKERDEETGFSYHGARYYAPWLGRWSACDSDKRSAHRNRYNYVRSNPVNYIDPNGLFEEPVHGATTYRFALAAGFKREDAAKIALASAGMDHDPNTRPGDNIGEMIKQIFLGRTKEFHFASPEKALRDLRGDISRGTKMDLTRLGQHLHTLEDVGFKNAPGPHMRSPERLLPGLTKLIGVSLVVGGLAALGVGGPVGVAVGLGMLVLGGLLTLFGVFSNGVSHPTYVTEKNQFSNSFSHKADEAYQDPESNKRELEGIYREMKDAAAAYYGGQVKSDDIAAEEAIKGVTEADTEEKLREYMDAKLDDRGNPSKNPKDKSYSQIVSDWGNENTKSTFPKPWSKFDATINDKPVLNSSGAR